jgi:hypothetical protein
MQEVVDSFPASWALLEADTAAGWTPYDIAVLCCSQWHLGRDPVHGIDGTVRRHDLGSFRFTGRSFDEKHLRGDDEDSDEQ